MMDRKYLNTTTKSEMIDTMISVMYFNCNWAGKQRYDDNVDHEQVNGKNRK